MLLQLLHLAPLLCVDGTYLVIHPQVQEAMLTGESVPASKHLAAAASEASLGDRKCMCYSATAVVSGQAQGVVVATGDSAEIGLINRMVGTVSGQKGVSRGFRRLLTAAGRCMTVCGLDTCFCVMNLVHATQAEAAMAAECAALIQNTEPTWLLQQAHLAVQPCVQSDLLQVSISLHSMLTIPA
jgi:magnesium-transporting ATPase (P-type)